MDTSFLSGANATFIAEMHKAWADNPANVDSHWADWFSSLGALSNDIESVPGWGSGPSKIVGANDPEASIKAVAKLFFSSLKPSPIAMCSFAFKYAVLA